MDSIDDLVLACRILFEEEQADTIFGHISTVDRKTNEIMIKPATIGFEEVRKEDFVTIDLTGRKLAGRHPAPGESPIHTEIYRARPDVGAVVHTHPFFCVLVSGKAKLLPYVHEAVLFNGTQIFDDAKVITDIETARRLASLLGKAPAVILRNHGIVTVGTQIRQACLRAVWLEKAAKAQFLAEISRNMRPISGEETRNLLDLVENEQRYQRVWDYYRRRLADGKVLSLS